MSRRELEQACMEGDLERVQNIVTQDPRLNVAYTLEALNYAITNKHFEIMAFLLNQEKDGVYRFKQIIHNRDDRYFSELCQNQPLEYVKYFISMEDKLGKFDINQALIRPMSLETFTYLINVRKPVMSSQYWYYIMINFMQVANIEGMRFIVSLIPTYPEIDIHFDHDDIIIAAGYHVPERKIELLEYLFSLEPIYGKFDIMTKSQSLLRYNLFSKLDINGLKYYVSLDRTTPFRFSDMVGHLLAGLDLMPINEGSDKMKSMIEYLLQCEKCIMDDIHNYNDHFINQIILNGNITLIKYVISLTKIYGEYPIENANLLFINRMSQVYAVDRFHYKLMYLVKLFKRKNQQLNLDDYLKYRYLTGYDYNTQIDSYNMKYLTNLGLVSNEFIL